MPEGLQHHPSQLIHEALDRILSSPEFQTSERNRCFLKYVVEEALAGRGDYIKAYSIATSVFGRGDGFDAQSDPIVRIEASRLRRALERYYLTGGAADPIRISIPKGAYVPAFASDGELSQPAPQDRLDQPEPVPPEPAPAVEHLPGPGPQGARLSVPKLRPAAAALVVVGVVGILAAAWAMFAPLPLPRPPPPAPPRNAPAILVAPFEAVGDSAHSQAFESGFTRGLILELTRFRDLHVFGPETTFGLLDERGAKQLIDELEIDYVVSGGATLSDQTFTVDILLMDAKTGRYRWSTRFTGDLDVEDVVRARNEAASMVAGQLGQAYGAIYLEELREIGGKPPEAWNSYECVVRFYKYWQSSARSGFAPVRDCLEEAVEVDPAYAEAFAALSLLSADAYRLGYGGASPAAWLEGALRHARRAVDLAPEGVSGHHALSLAYWLSNDVERSLEAARTGLQFNPHDTHLLADLGLRYAMRNELNEARPLLRDAFGRNPGLPSAYRIGFFLDHYLNERYAEALAEALKIDTPTALYGYITVAMAAGQVGKSDLATKAVQEILAIDPDYGARVRDDLAKRNVHPAVVSAVVDGLRKAGLPVPP